MKEKNIMKFKPSLKDLQKLQDCLNTLQRIIDVHYDRTNSFIQQDIKIDEIIKEFENKWGQ